MEQLLIIGAETVVGSNLAQVAGDRFQILTASAETALHRARQSRPDWIVYCPSNSQSTWDAPKTCGCDEPALAAALAQHAQGSGAELTVISSAAVFGGSQIFHRESEELTSETPADQAARTIEAAIPADFAWIVRTDAFGTSPAGDSWAERVWQQLTAGEATSADGLRYATPIHAIDLAEMLIAGYRQKLRGAFHLAGAERVNPYEFARELARLCDGPRWQNQTAEEVLPLEATLDTSRARRVLKLAMPMLAPGLIEFARQMEASQPRPSLAAA